jgi:flagellar hook protein FlgE
LSLASWREKLSLGRFVQGSKGKNIMAILGSMLVASGAMDMFSNSLAVTGDNIANLNTVGFKTTRFNFGDIMPTVSGEIETGHGARLADVGKPFQQGTLETTGNTTDLAISGYGFFVVRDPLAGALRYTRAGQFHFDSNGQLVNAGDKILQGSGGDITIDTTAAVPAQATASLALQFNLDASSVTPTTPFPAGPDASSASWIAASNFSSVQTVYDSQGDSHDLTFLFRQTAPNNWDYHVVAPRSDLDAGAPTSADWREVSTPGTLVFTASGQLDTASSTITDISGLTWTNGASQTIAGASLDFTGTVQFAGPSALLAALQDGFASGTLTGISIDDQGNINGNFTNGTSQILASIALANFANVDDLDPLGDTLFAPTFESGAAQTGVAGQNGLGSINSATLELSTVDLAQQFVSLIGLQRAFQVNSKVVTTADQMYSIAAELKGN